MISRVWKRHFDIFSTPGAMDEIRQAEAEIERGEFVSARRAPQHVLVEMTWGLRVAASAERSLRRLPEKAAVAAVEFITRPLLERSRLVGKPLSREFSGYLAARRGQYRIVYRLIESEEVVEVVRIDHRSRVYRMS